MDPKKFEDDVESVRIKGEQWYVGLVKIQGSHVAVRIHELDHSAYLFTKVYVPKIEAKCHVSFVMSIDYWWIFSY